MSTKTDVLYKLIDFAEENWSAFIFRCKESGITEEEVDFALEELKGGTPCQD